MQKKHLNYSEIFNDNFIANLLMSVAVKDLLKLVIIWWSCETRKKLGELVFAPPCTLNRN